MSCGLDLREKKKLNAKAIELHAVNGGDAAKTAKALRDEFGLEAGFDVEAEEISRALYAKKGLKLSAEETAKALRDGLGLSVAEVARVLESQWGLFLSANKVAKVLRSPDGFNLSIEEVARVLRDKEGIDLEAERVAWALYARDGLNLSAEETAKVLHYGLGIAQKEVAEVLYSRNGLNLYFEKVTETLNAAGFGEVDSASTSYKTQTDKYKKWAERIRAEFTRPSITPIAALQELYKEIKDATETARALRDVLNHTTAEVAWALYYGLNLTAEDTAKALRDGIDLTAAEVAWALYSDYGLDLTAEDTAKALRDGLNLTDEEVTAALKDAKIAPEQFHAEKVTETLNAAGFGEVDSASATYKTASEIRAEKNTSKKGIK